MLSNPSASRALLVGAAEYATLNELPAVANNLRGLQSALTDPAIWGLPPENCRILSQPDSADTVLNALQQVGDAATDTLIFYYAGHGLIDPGNDDDLHLALPGSDLERAFRTAVPYSWVRREIQAARVRRKVVILDCCYSGRALGKWMSGEVGVGDRLDIDGTCVLTATARTRRALARPGEHFTVFTGELIDVLTRGVPDGPDLLDMDTLYQHLTMRLRAKSLPLPQRGQLDHGGAIVLARNQATPTRPGPVASPEPAEQPEEVGVPGAKLPESVAASSAQLRTIREQLSHGDDLLARRHFQQAAEAYQEVLLLEPGSASAHAGLSLALSGQEIYEKAEEQSRQAAEADPDCMMALLSLGVVRTGQRRYLEAEVAFREAIQLYPDSAEAHRYLGEAALLQHRWDEAMSAFRAALEIDSSNVSARFGLGIAQEEAGQYRGARKTFSEVVRRAPGYADAHYHLGRVMQRAGASRAEKAYQEATRYDRAHAAAYQALGISALWKDQWAEAEHAFREALQADSGSVTARQYLAAALAERGRFDEAKEILRTAIALKPSDPSPRIQLGYLLCQTGDEEAAQAICDDLELSDLPRASTCEYLAGLLETLGHSGEAATVYREAIRRDSRNYETHLFLCHLLWKANREDEAQVEMREFRRTRRIAKRADRGLMSTAAAAAMEGLPQASGENPEAARVLTRTWRCSEIWAYSGDQLSGARRALSILIYLVPIINLFGLFSAVRAIRVNTIQAFVLDIGVAASAILTYFAASAYSDNNKTPNAILNALTVIAFTITVPALLYCLIFTATRRPPRIRGLTEIATRIVYGPRRVERRALPAAS
jgi:tetratricopeptide (TPR) repeat protein